MILAFKSWFAEEIKRHGKHGGDRKSKNPFTGMVGDVRAVNPARDVLPFPPGPMQPRGTGKTAGRLNKPRSGIVGRMKKK